MSAGAPRMIVDVLADVLLGSMFYWLAFFYTGFALGVFLVRVHECMGRNDSVNSPPPPESAVRFGHSPDAVAGPELPRRPRAQRRRAGAQPALPAKSPAAGHRRHAIRHHVLPDALLSSRGERERTAHGATHDTCMYSSWERIYMTSCSVASYATRTAAAMAGAGGRTVVHSRNWYRPCEIRTSIPIHRTVTAAAPCAGEIHGHPIMLRAGPQHTRDGAAAVLARLAQERRPARAVGGVQDDRRAHKEAGRVGLGLRRRGHRADDHVHVR